MISRAALCRATLRSRHLSRPSVAIRLLSTEADAPKPTFPESSSIPIPSTPPTNVPPKRTSEARLQAQAARPQPSKTEKAQEEKQPGAEEQQGQSKQRRFRAFRPLKAAMTLSPSAVSQLRRLLDQPEPKLIKIGLKQKGCSGLSYDLQYVDKPDRLDEVVEQDGVRLVIDNRALMSVIGSEMHWVEDVLSRRFVFRNPNIKQACGCGESFMV